MSIGTIGKRVAVATASLALCASIGIAAAFADAPAEPAADGGATTAATMQDWGEQYPLQWESYHQKPVKADGKTHGHFDLQEKLLAPVVRDGTNLIKSEDGYYQISGFEWNQEIGRWVIDEEELGAVPANAFKMGCYSCKSSNFDLAYEEWGAEIFTQDPTPEFIELINGQVWDCATCHEGDPGTSAPDAQLTYWTQLARESYNEFDPSERVCGQCHNSLDYRSHITDQETMDTFSPYRYGFDVQNLYDAVLEDGICAEDEAGIMLSTLSHPDIEFTQGSAMRELGVTCVDCHMPETTDPESGAVYTSHNAQQSPLENETALEFCLTCHSAQGIETTADMAQMVRDLQEETAVEMDALQVRLDETHAQILETVEQGGMDEGVLDQVRYDWGLAKSYFDACQGSAGNGVKVAHNPSAMADYIARAGALLDGIVESLA